MYFQNVTHLDDDLENENKEELEENLIDFKLKFRQSAIDEIVNKFSAELSSITDPQLLDQPSESNLTCFYESILTV